MNTCMSMPLNKKGLLVLYLTVISSIWLLILGLDWSRLLLFSTLNRIEEFALSKLAKLIASLCVILFVWSSGGFSLNKKDGYLDVCCFYRCCVDESAASFNSLFLPC
jgi:hypothetical protein